jgi:hypothetical protein
MRGGLSNCMNQTQNDVPWDKDQEEILMEVFTVTG